MGYTRIQGALSNLGHQVARGTVANVLQAEAIDPAPDRGTRSTWKQFLTAHWELLAVADFFYRGGLDPVGLVRYHVFFTLRLATRDVHIAGIIPEPHGRWIEQVARPTASIAFSPIAATSSMIVALYTNDCARSFSWQAFSAFVSLIARPI